MSLQSICHAMKDASVFSSTHYHQYTQTRSYLLGGGYLIGSIDFYIN